MRVVEVRDSGVLVLTNQAGQRFEKHMEHCTPCMLPNLAWGDLRRSDTPTRRTAVSSVPRSPALGLDADVRQLRLRLAHILHVATSGQCSRR
jgi:hypothetical protein